MTETETGLLETVCNTAEMGGHTLKHLLSQSRDPAFSDVIRRQQRAYAKTASEARKKLAQAGIAPKPTPVTDAMAALGVRLNTMIDASSSHMAQMMIEGSTMGVVTLQRQLNIHPDAGGEAKRMAKELLQFEEKSIEGLKPYL